PQSIITTEFLLSFVMQCKIIVAFMLSCIVLSVSAAPTPDLSKVNRESVRHDRTYILPSFFLTFGRKMQKRRQTLRQI
ncbi:hypothetical protein C8J57DRAFT_1366150, partial [Mycena rebaudengoi]